MKIVYKPKLKLGTLIVDGFYSPKNDVIYINSARPKLVRIITLFHESIHWVIDKVVRIKKVDYLHFIWDSYSILIDSTYHLGNKIRTIKRMYRYYF
ncbi:MAG: hypothetical protein DRZ76_01840 [Candidatus Nealsonbacteria bacterium]|nr:MAG: hypothetical protein DRZ76_01840 [Candidatus Nealsonbacteria bacterium]